MKKSILVLTSIVSLAFMPGMLVADNAVQEWSNVTVKGGHKSKNIARLNPGTYSFKLTIKTKARKPKVKFKISQKNAVVGRKKLYQATFGKGTHKGTFVVQARRLTSASGSVAGEVHNKPGSAGGSAAGGFSANMQNVDATRKIIFKVKNPVGKKKIKYTLIINKK